MLLMKKTFFDAIRRRAKTTTLRYWRWAHVKADSLHNVRGLGVLKIDEIRPIDPAKLTDADAQSDGFADLHSLLNALDELYPPHQRDRRQLFKINFTLISVLPPKL